MSEYIGIGTAMVTPFKDGEVDYACYERLLKRQMEAGIDFIVALGTTAETPCLEKEEKLKILEATKKTYNGRLMIGAGSNSLKATVDNIKAYDVFEPDAWLVVVPYYNKPSQAGLYEYYRAVAMETHRDIFVYNVPGRTGITMLPETLARLAEIPNIKGIKEASDSSAYSVAMREAVGNDFICLTGNDEHWLELSTRGYQGVISVASNIVPVQMMRLGNAIKTKEFGIAYEMNLELEPLFKACFADGNPTSVKTALWLMGLCRNELRLPLTVASAHARQLIHRELERLNML